MTEIVKTSSKAAKARPPYLVLVLGLVAAVGIALFMGYQAFRHEGMVHENFRAIERMWDDRAVNSSLPNQEQNLSNAIEDKQALKSLESKYQHIYRYVSYAIACLVLVVLLVFFGYHAALVRPLRKLESSCRDISAKGLQGHVWGLDRDDQYGALARSVDEIRNSVIKLSDMVIEGPDGKSHIQFGGRGAAAFNTLVADMQDSIARINSQGQKLEEISSQKQEGVLQLDETVHRTTQSLEAAVDASRLQLAGLQDEWVNRFTTLSAQHSHIQEQAGKLVNQFGSDMGTLRQIATATGQRVTQMLQNLGNTDHDYKRAAKLSLEASEAFSREAADLSEKLNAATSLLRASGKVMSETTETTRTRLLDAIKSVTGHDEALKAFLNETADKTERVTSLFDDMKINAMRVADVVVNFDARMSGFESKSDAAFNRIENGSTIIEAVSGQLDSAHEMLTSSMEAMRGHTDMLAQILTSIRDEYAGFMDDWRNSLSEATPAIAQLKDTSNKLQGQLSEEWTLYAQQSRQLLTALEQDVRGMNARTAQVASDADQLIGNLNSQSQRLADSANHFDLQVGNLSQRMEDAASSVLRSNEHVVNLTSSQIREVHTAVGDMVQRLSILTQLTGTLGSVAGQLGQIVPALGDMRQMQHAGIPVMGSGGFDLDMMNRFEKISSEFGSTVGQVKGEFNAVRSQISKWVDMLTSGYQHLATQVGSIDGVLEARINALKSDLGQLPSGAAGAPSGNPDLLPVIKLVHQSLQEGNQSSGQILSDLQTLQGSVQSVGQHVMQTAGILQSMSSIVGDGFARLDQQIGEGKGTAEAPASSESIGVNSARLEQASAAMEGLMRSMQSQSFSLVERLGQVTEALATTSDQLQHKIQDASQRVESATSDAKGMGLLQKQISTITSLLDQCAEESKHLAESDADNIPEKSRAITESIRSAIASLNQISVAMEGPDEPPPPSEKDEQKAG
jgi:methyl-accepting chemotaxis protein